MQLSPTRLKGTLSPWHATTIYETAQDRACQEMQSNTGFCFETAMDLHTSAPRSLPWSATKSRATEGCVGQWGQPSTPARAAHTAPGTNPHPAPGGWQQAAVSQDAPSNAKRTSKFLPSLPQHTHRGCRTGGQTMRITRFTFEPKMKDFKPQSGAKHAPSSQSRGAFPNHVDRSCWHWLHSTRRFFFLWRLRTVLLCKNTSGQIFLLPLLVVLSWVGRQRDAGPVQSITIYQEADISPHFGSMCEGGHAPRPPSSVSRSNSSNTQTSINHLATDPGSSPERK